MAIDSNYKKSHKDSCGKKEKCIKCKKYVCECRKICDGCKKGSKSCDCESSTSTCCDGCKKGSKSCDCESSTSTCCDGCKKYVCECKKVSKSCDCESSTSICCDSCKKETCECKKVPKSCCKEEVCDCNIIKKRDECISDPQPCEIIYPFVQKGKLPSFTVGISPITISLVEGVLLDTILNIQLWIYTNTNGWITQGDITYPFSCRVLIDGRLVLEMPTNTMIVPQSPYRLIIQMATKFILNETG